MQKFLKRAWEKHFQTKAQGKQAAVWDQSTTGATLQKALPVAEASITTQLYTEAVGLRAYLSKWGVPGIQGECECRPYRETIHHMILFCPRRNAGCAEMLGKAGTRSLSAILSTRKGISTVTRWIFKEGYLPQISYIWRLQQQPSQLNSWQPLETLEELTLLDQEAFPLILQGVL